MTDAPDVSADIFLEGPIDFTATVGPLRHGPADPTVRVTRTGMWRAGNTPVGPATVHLDASALDERRGGHVAVLAFGPGAEWAAGQAGALLGVHDDPTVLVEVTAPNARLQALARRHVGMRVGRVATITEVLVPTILGQKVQSTAAHRSYAALVRSHGTPAPGPEALIVPPSPAKLAALAYDSYHRFDIERRRAETMRSVCARATSVDRLFDRPVADGLDALRSLPGIGPWTAGIIGLVCFGDPDAVIVGDFHIPNQVAWALAGEPRADDARMLELLEPFRGQRGRVQRLLKQAGPKPPAYGPRLAVRTISRT